MDLSTELLFTKISSAPSTISDLYLVLNKVVDLNGSSLDTKRECSSRPQSSISFITSRPLDSLLCLIMGSDSPLCQRQLMSIDLSSQYPFSFSRKQALIFFLGVYLSPPPSHVLLEGWFHSRDGHVPEPHQPARSESWSHSVGQRETHDLSSSSPSNPLFGLVWFCFLIDLIFFRAVFDSQQNWMESTGSLHIPSLLIHTYIPRPQHPPPDSIFVAIGEPTLTHRCHSKSIVNLTVQSWWYRFRQM